MDLTKMSNDELIELWDGYDDHQAELSRRLDLLTAEVQAWREIAGDKHREGWFIDVVEAFDRVPAADATDAAGFPWKKETK